MCEYSSPCCGCCVWLPLTLLCVWVRLLCCGCCVTTTYCGCCVCVSTAHPAVDALCVPLILLWCCVWVLLTLLYAGAGAGCHGRREAAGNGDGADAEDNHRPLLPASHQSPGQGGGEGCWHQREAPPQVHQVGEPSLPPHPHRRPIPSLSSGRPPTPTPQNKLGAISWVNPPTHTHTNTHTGRPHHKFRWVNPPSTLRPHPKSIKWVTPPHMHTHREPPPPSPSSGWPPSPTQGGPPKSMKWVNAPTPHREPPPPCQWVNPPPQEVPPPQVHQVGDPPTHTHIHRGRPHPKSIRWVTPPPPTHTGRPHPKSIRWVTPPPHTHTEGGPTPSPLGGWPPLHTHTHTGRPHPKSIRWVKPPASSRADTSPCWPHTPHSFPQSWCGWWYGSTVRCYIHTGYPAGLTHSTVSLGHDVGGGMVQLWDATYTLGTLLASHTAPFPSVMMWVVVWFNCEMLHTHWVPIVSTDWRSTWCKASGLFWPGTWL